MIKCDCKPLVCIFGPKKGTPVMKVGRLQRYAVFFSGYNFKIQFIITSEKIVLMVCLDYQLIKKKIPKYHIYIMLRMKIMNSNLVKKKLLKIHY